MKNILLLFKGDIKRLTSNVVTIIIVLGLVCMPSIFSWYNILASWNVFGNTGNLTVAVANADEGYESDLVPLRVNVGEQVVSSLRANDQLNWEFTSEEDAIDGAKAGRYYAAVVIPPSFSRDMLTFYAQDSEHADIVYYTNEKKSAVAPKITGQGADAVSHEINRVFTEKLSEISLALATSLSRYAEEGDAGGHIAKLADHITATGQQMTHASQVLVMYADMLDSAQGLVQGSAALLGQAQDAAGDVGAAAGESRNAVKTTADAMNASVEALVRALEQSAQGYAGVSEAVDEAFASTGETAQTAASALDNQTAQVQAQVERYQDLKFQLETIRDSGAFTEGQKAAFDAVIARLDASIALQQNLADSLSHAAESIRTGNANTQEQYADVKAKAEAARASVEELKGSYEADVKPDLEQLVAETAALVDRLSSSADDLAAAGGALQGSAQSVSGRLDAAQAKLEESAETMQGSSQRLADLGAAIHAALESGNADSLRAILAQDPSTLASALAAPVHLDRHAVFPADNFGSQMAPLYATLAIWIGSLLMAVVVRTTVSEKARSALHNPRPYQIFLGRFGVFSLLSFLQTSVLAIGNMAFLGVQANHPVLYLLCFWIAGQVFAFIIYTLVVSFANLGKAVGVVLLIVQVTSGGGSFPLPMLPHFFQALSPYVPATHAINAMRAAMMGVYQNDFWIEIGTLLLFVIPFALVGLFLSKPLGKFMDQYIKRVEASKLMS